MKKGWENQLLTAELGEGKSKGGSQVSLAGRRKEDGKASRKKQKIGEPIRGLFIKRGGGNSVMGGGKNGFSMGVFVRKQEKGGTARG